MKGIIFTEFMEMVETNFGYSIANKIIVEEKLASKGVYTSIGTYKSSEMHVLVHELSELSNIPIPKLLYAYGEYLFTSFCRLYPALISAETTTLSFLESIDSHIHVEVLKLYPDAELPKFKTKLINQNKLEMNYLSERALSHFAHGLLAGCVDHFKEGFNIEYIKNNENGTDVTFIISK